MTYLLNLLLVPIYYGILRLLFRRKMAERCFVWIFAVHAILFRALAYPFDFVDTANYAKAFQEISSYRIDEIFWGDARYVEWGRGYVVLNWLISLISRDYEFLFIVLSVVSVGCAAWFYSKTSYVILLTVSIYLLYPTLYRMGFAVLRQHLAVAAVLTSLYYVKNYKVSIPLAILAPLLHASGIVMLPFFVWRKISFRKLHQVDVAALTVAAAIAMRLIAGYLVGAVGTVSSSNRYSHFADSGENSNLIPVILIGLTVAMAMMGGLYNRCRDRDYEILNFMAYGLAVSLFGIGLYGAGRLTIFFLYVMPVAVTFPFHYARHLRSVSIVCLSLLMILTARQMYHLHTSWLKNYDYKFYWEKPRLK